MCCDVINLPICTRCASEETGCKESCRLLPDEQPRESCGLSFVVYNRGIFLEEGGGMKNTRSVSPVMERMKTARCYIASYMLHTQYRASFDGLNVCVVQRESVCVYVLDCVCPVCL